MTTAAITPHTAAKKKRARKTSLIPTRIYSYRCLPPITEAARVEEQYRLAAQYRNALVEIEHALRAQLREVQLEHPTIGPALRLLDAAQAEIDATYDALRAAKSGTASPDLTDLRERLAAGKRARDEAAEVLREAKRSSADLGRARAALVRAESALVEGTPEVAREAVVAREVVSSLVAKHPADVVLLDGYAAARAVHHQRGLAAREDYSGRGLRHGAYARVEDSVRQAAASTRRPLRFESYDGSGSIGTQLTERKRVRSPAPGAPSSAEGTSDAEAPERVLGMTLPELLSVADLRLRLGGPGALDAHPRAEVGACASWDEAQRLSRNLRRHAARTWVDLRIGSNPDRSPIFARFPVTLHRLPPKDSVIKWAHVVRYRIGHHLEWRLQLTLESRTFERPAVAFGTGICAINLGWRRLLDDEGEVLGLRAAYVVDQDGLEREIRVPDYRASHGDIRVRPVLGAVAKCDDLGSIRDKALERMQISLSTWLAERGGIPQEWQTPEPLRLRLDGSQPRSMADRLRGYSAWRSASKLRRFVDAWRTRRLEGDAEAFEALVAWAKQDRHLESWQASMRDWLIAHRREEWRIVATWLARGYATILVGEGKLTKIDGWERPSPEEGDPSDGRLQRRMARLAAPGELLAEIVKAAAKTGATVLRCNEKFATQTCALCGSAAPWEAAPRLEHTCSACGATWDQDANHGRNLLARERSARGGVPESSGVAESGVPESSGVGRGLAEGGASGSRAKSRSRPTASSLQVV